MGLIPEGDHLFFALVDVGGVLLFGPLGADLLFHALVQVNFNRDAAVFFPI